MRMTAKGKTPRINPRRNIAELEAELERRIAERDEALARETAVAEVLQVINRSPGDLAPVFDAILQKALSLCDAAHGHLTVYQDGHFHCAAAQGDPHFVEWFRGRAPYGPGPGTTMEKIVQGASVVQVADATDDEAYWLGDPVRRAVAEIGGSRTVVSVALCKEETLFGAVTVYRQEVRPFTNKQIALLQNFAAQAVIAMENARLITETREALEQQTATAEVLQVINASPGDLAPVFDAMLRKAARLCEAAFGTLWIRDGDVFKFAAHHGVPADLEKVLHSLGPIEPLEGSALRRLLDGEDVLQFRDLAVEALPGRPGGRRAALIQLGGARTTLWVGLRKDDVLVGVVHLYRREVRPFTVRQIALLQNFAAQAVIAMENARLITETREALEQQTAAADVLGVINSSPGDLAPVFDAILEKAHTLCGAAVGLLGRFDGETWRAVAQRGYEEPLASKLLQRARGSDVVLQKLIDGARFVHVADPARMDNPIAETYVAAGVRTVLVVALRKDDALLGTISIARREARPFSDKEITLLQNFAAQAVIAMENARLLTETREALEQQTATAEVLQVINSSPGDLAPVFDAMLEKAIRLCDGAHGTLWMFDGDRQYAAAAAGVPAELATQLREPRDILGYQQRLRSGERVFQIPDLAATEAYRSGNPLTKLAVEAGGVRTVAFVSLVKDATAVGGFTIARKVVRPFTDKQIALLENFADQAVIAMENARLLGELRQRTDEVAELNRGLEARVAAQVEELGRVGRLKRFLAPQLAELIVSQGDEKILESHRREIVVVFCDLRGYTAFTETAEPEEVLEFLREYHGALGPLVSQFEGTLDQFSGDGIMVFFNDPVPCPDPAERAVKMAMAMREEAGKLIATWRRDGCELGFGAGIAQGYATLGQIGFSERSGYTAIGTVCNLAARLCAAAKDGQILISSRVARAVDAVARLEDLGNLELKGLRRPVAAFNVGQSISPAEARPNLTVVARGPGV
jgi:class 3 adenylate cyclase/prephenate dehydratase